MDIRSLILTEEDLKKAAAASSANTGKAEKPETVCTEPKKRTFGNVAYEVIKDEEFAFEIRRTTSRSSTTMIIDPEKKRYVIRNDETGNESPVTSEDIVKFMKDHHDAQVTLNNTVWIGKVLKGKPFADYFQKFLEDQNESLILKRVFGISGSAAVDLTLTRIAAKNRKNMEIVIDAILKRYPGIKRRDIITESCLFVRRNYKKMDLSSGGRIPSKAVLLMKETMGLIRFIESKFGDGYARRFAADFFDSPLSSNGMDDISMAHFIGYTENDHYAVLRKFIPDSAGDRFIEYVLYDLPRQGYADNISLGISIWANAFRTQDRMFGKIKDLFPEYVESENTKLDMIEEISSRFERPERSSKYRSVEWSKIPVMKEKNDKLIKARAKELEHLSWCPGDETYKMVVPASRFEFSKETMEQQNRPAKKFTETIRTDTALIFMRRQNPDKEDTSLVTIELKGNTLVDARGRNNCLPDPGQQTFIRRWAEEKGINMM